MDNVARGIGEQVADADPQFFVAETSGVCQTGKGEELRVNLRYRSAGLQFEMGSTEYRFELKRHPFGLTGIVSVLGSFGNACRIFSIASSECEIVVFNADVSAGVWGSNL